MPWDRHKCARVLDDVFFERERQEARYGGINDDLIDGTGPLVQWLETYTKDPALEVQRRLRHDYELHEHINGLPTWMHLVREEVAEAFQEDDPERLTEELIQVAALCVSWVERIRARLPVDVADGVAEL